MTKKENIEPKGHTSKHKPQQFSRKDCEKLVEIYLKKRKSKLSWGLRQTEIDPISSMQRDLNIALAHYDTLKLRTRAPTKRQLRGKHDTVRNSAKKLLSHLEKSTDYHFIAALVAAKSGKSSAIFLDDDKFHDAYDDLRSLGLSLQKLIDSLDLCLKEDFAYEEARSDKQLAETKLARLLSAVLTKYFEEKGHGRGAYGPKNSAMGWRIDCLEHLFNAVKIPYSRTQMLDSIT